MKKNTLKLQFLFGGKMWYVFIYQTRAHAQKNLQNTQYTLYFHGRYMAFFFLTFVHIFFMKKSDTYVKKTCQDIMKKVMIMIEFFTICT